MNNIQHLFKVWAAWTSILYTICYGWVALYPGVRPWFMRYSLHADVTMTSNYFGWGYYITGLVVWNVVALFSVWLFTTLYNSIKK